MQGLSAYVRTSTVGLSRNLRLVGGRVLVETAILAATLMPFLLGWKAIQLHLGKVLPNLPPTFQPGQLVAADLLLYLSSPAFLWPFGGLLLAAGFLAAGLRWAQRAAELGTLSSLARGDDDPPRGVFESIAGYLDRSAAVGVLEVLGLLCYWGWAAGILFGGFSFWQAASAVSPGWGVLASFLLAFGLTLVIGVGVLVHALFPLALTGSIAAGWRPTVAPARALSLLLRRPLLLLSVGGLILAVRVAVGLLVGSVASFAMMLPPEVLLSGPGQVARGIETLIGMFTGGVITVFSHGLLAALVLDDVEALPIPARPAPPPPPPTPVPVFVFAAVPAGSNESVDSDESVDSSAPEPILRAVPVEVSEVEEPIYEARPLEIVAEAESPEEAEFEAPEDTPEDDEA